MKTISLNMQDIRTAVKTIKTAILKSRYMAARQANVEHLKLYFRVGAYVSANSRNGTWGTGAIAAISEKLSIELPGLRGFSPTNMKNMRIFFEQWVRDENRQLPTDDLRNYLADETLPAIRQLSTGELSESDIAAFFSIGFTHHKSAYKALKPLLEGSQKLLAEMNCGSSASTGKGKMTVSKRKSKP